MGDGSSKPSLKQSGANRGQGAIIPINGRHNVWALLLMGEIIFVGVVGALIFAAYYSLVLFPRQRDFAKRQRMARELAAGDEIVTYGGIIGKVKHIDSSKGIALVEIADGVTVRLVIAAMVGRYDPEEIARNARMGQDTNVEMTP